MFHPTMALKKTQIPPKLLKIITISSIAFILFTIYLICTKPISPNPQNTLKDPTFTLKVYIFALPKDYYNYNLLKKYYSLPPDRRIPSDPDHEPGSRPQTNPPRYPENPVIKQYSAEYWILGDLLTDDVLRAGNSFAKRVYDESVADVVFVPFFAALSCEMQLSVDTTVFRKKVVDNQDFVRQKEVVDLVLNSDRWKRSGGRDHVFVLTDPMAMWHVKREIAPAILLVVDFGGWYRLDSRSSNGNSSERIPHTQVSLLKDVIVPYTHLLPALPLSEDQQRRNLLYFKGAKHRHRGGVIREKLWDLLVNEPRVIMEEGFPNATGREQSIKGMRTSEFCLHPAGDTPTSCRLFDAIQSLCIPVIVSDHIELPFEGMIDYSDFSVFVSVNDALQPNWLVTHLKSISKKQKDEFRRNMARVQPTFVYDNGYPGGIGPVPRDGAVNHIWKKVYEKLPMIKEAIIRDRRKPSGVSIPSRCQCI